MDANWAETEISFRDGNANGGWVFITFFRAANCPTYTCFDTLSPTHLDLNWATDWVHFAEEGILVRIDNNNSKANQIRLFHTRTRSSEYYWAILRGAISRDGHYVVFDGNFDISNTGLTNYTDVYLSKTHRGARIQAACPAGDCSLGRRKPKGVAVNLKESCDG